ncbi:response regulator receiver domain-containing protein [Hephaestia caeni]|uniref:Response regulator receiver domain-containing protein n=1 Tax=Hephaestia caeni TaxID=645617 RepID=A0A397NM28_9SPHN|nr:response regulator [Hephaestia caeni]RIA36649.1 response regulator receiver domain-containing protein [Hephaestia caeni]
MLFAKKNRRIKRLLIVEDEPLVAFDTERYLTDEGFGIAATVDTVAEAIALLGSGEVDLVLVDVTLPDGSGIAVAEAARARGVHALFVTGDCPMEARGVAAGCLAKPYAQRDLLQSICAIDDVLRGKKPRRLPGGFSLFLETAA